MNNTNLSNEQNDLFSSSHLMVLITFTVSTILLIGESILLGWEKFILPLTGREALCLPSTSPANARWTQDMLTDAWRVILRPGLCP